MASHSSPGTMTSIFNTLYLVFFTIHIPLMLLVDFYPLYPTHLIPEFMTGVRKWYIATYKDRFFVPDTRPGWFMLFTWIEVLLHVPVSVYGVWVFGRRRDTPLTHLVLLVFALEVTFSTAVCVAEYSSWPELDTAERKALGGLYVPYLVLALGMSIDMLFRLVPVLDLAQWKKIDGKSVKAE